MIEVIQDRQLNSKKKQTIQIWMGVTDIDIFIHHPIKFRNRMSKVFRQCDVVPPHLSLLRGHQPSYE